MKTTLGTDSKPDYRVAPVLLGLLLLAVAAAWFANIEYRHLSDPDEGRYAEISREMLVSGDWVTPTLNGFRYFEKPPLQYWATAAALQVFGTHVWTARLYVTLLSLLTAVFVYWVGRVVWDSRTGIFAAVILLSNLMWITIGHINTLDLGLAAWLTGAVGLLVVAQVQQQQRWAVLASWAMLALAVLSKGPVAVVLLALPVVLYSLIERQFRWWRDFRFPSGLLVLAVIVAPWFVLVSMRNDTFAHFFFIHEHLERYLTKVHKRYEPMWYFIPVLLLGTLPWTWAMLRGAWAAWKDEQHSSGFRAGRFLVLYAAGIFAFFSVSDSKLPPYIVPMFPPLALLAGRYLAARTSQQLIRTLLPTAVVTAIIGCLAAALTLLPVVPKLTQYAAYGRWILVAAVVMAAGPIIARRLLQQSNPVAAIGALGAAGLLFGQLVVTGNDTLSDRRSGAAIAGVIEQRLTPDARLYMVDQYLQSVPFYLQRTARLAVYQGELEMGIGLDRSRWLPTIDDFVREWQQPGPAIATIEPRLYPSIVERRLPAEVIHRDVQSVVIAKR
jgi:4-amino-4-deoxy-L-arabinose transferase-like glycosyltransferase